MKSTRKPTEFTPSPTNVQVLKTGKYVRLVRDGGWEYVERVGASGVVTIVAVTVAREIVLIEQYRPPLKARVIELPAGLSGDIAGSETELLETAAERELLEETGYQARKMKYLTAGPTSAGQSNEIITFFLATGVKKVADGGGDSSEDIQIHLVPLDKCESWLKRAQKRGVTVDPRIFAGLYFAGRHLKPIAPQV